MIHPDTQMIEITTRIKATGFVDKALLNHLGRMVEGKLFAALVFGQAKPGDADSASRYRGTELELMDVQRTAKPANHHTTITQ